MALLGSAIFLVIAPGTLAVYVPWTFTRWRMAPPLFGFSSLRILGGLMIAAGLPVLLDSFARFAIQGLGTPAPVAPPQRLVVTGLYRYVRNPMISGVVFIVFGEALVLVSRPHALWALFVLCLNLMYIPILEEPMLDQRFGSAYQEYLKHVPRFFPRLRPWNPDDDTDG